MKTDLRREFEDDPLFISEMSARAYQDAMNWENATFPELSGLPRLEEEVICNRGEWSEHEWNEWTAKRNDSWQNLDFYRQSILIHAAEESLNYVLSKEQLISPDLHEAMFFRYFKRNYSDLFKLYLDDIRDTFISGHDREAFLIRFTLMHPVDVERVNKRIFKELYDPDRSGRRKGRGV